MTKIRSYVNWPTLSKKLIPLKNLTTVPRKGELLELKKLISQGSIEKLSELIGEYRFLILDITHSYDKHGHYIIIDL